ncbi:MAG: TonB-dependent receptor, partial [Desulfobacterales bacterium]
GVSIDDVDSRSRRKKSQSPNDEGRTTDIRVRGGLETDMGAGGVIKINGGLRFRDNDFVLGFTPLKSKSDQRSHIEEDTQLYDLNYVKEYAFWRRDHKFQLGIDYYDTDYVSERVDENQRKNSWVSNLGLFFTHEFGLRRDLRLNLGYRYNDYRGTFRNDERRDLGGGQLVWVKGNNFDRNYDNNAYSVGLVYSPGEDTSFFASYATSFRVPNVDEFALAEDDLKPQEGAHIDVGLRQRLWDLAEFSVTLFQIEIEDEIFFDSNLQVNRNFDDTTRRRGIETNVKLYPFKNLYLWGNYTYLEAKFEDRNTDVPLVPNHVANVGLEWRIVEPFLFAFTGTLVGSQFDGNDENNDTFKKLEAYRVFDAKLTYTYKNFKLFGGVNNIFDELYSTVAFSEVYFPMPTRNFYGGIQWSF